MKDIVLVTSNQHKAHYFSQMIGMDVENIAIDVEEIQSLDIREVATHKVKLAYAVVKRPVVVEDTQLVFHALGLLPGPFIKWFLDSLGVEGLCKLLEPYADRTATAGAVIAYFDGTNLELFEKSLSGKIADSPRGSSGFGWNRIFIPEGSDKTLGEMDEEEFELFYKKVKAFDELAKFLNS